jgi:hypothetical protein
VRRPIPRSHFQRGVTNALQENGTRFARLNGKERESEAAMPLKPNGAVCKVREQIVEDEASGLILQFECDNGRMRLVIAGPALPFGNREILFDDNGRQAGAGTLVGAFRRPSWLKPL